jgi:hypothetical protein
MPATSRAKSLRPGGGLWDNKVSLRCVVLIKGHWLSRLSHHNL